MTGKEVGEPGIVGIPDGYATVTDALRSTLAELDLGEEDAAAAALAWRLAETIDIEENGRTIAELARQLLPTLESLGATPAARKALAKGVNTDAGDLNRNAALDELRKRRDSRAYRASAVDPAAP